jgi:HK97 family phage major capsid protein
MPEERRRELAKALQTKVAEIDGMVGSWKTEEGGEFVISTEEHAKYKKTVADAKQIKELIADEEEADGLREFLAAPVDKPAAVTDAQRTAQPQGTKTLADYVLESEDYKQKKAAGWRDPTLQVSVEGSIFNMGERKDMYTAAPGNITLPALPNVQMLAPVELARRQMHVRDLFPSATTAAAVLYGLRETGWTNNAAQVPQRRAADETSPPTGGASDVFGRKPKSDIRLEPVMFPVATVAHTLDAHKNMLDDAPRMADFINRRMTEGVKFAEDDIILFGSPGGEQITGIWNTPGVQTYTGLDTDKFSAQIRRAATRAALAEYQATGVVVSLLDWEGLELETDNYGAYRIAISVAVGAQKQIWRLQVVDTTAMPEGRFLLGAFGLAAQWYDRQQVNVVVSTENRDNFERNAVTIRAEERGALEVSRPEAFVCGTLTTPA